MTDTVSGSKKDDTYGDNDARVWLYVKLTPYPLSHGPRGPIGWVGHGKSGPLNFGPAAMAVTDVYTYIKLVLPPSRQR